MNHIFTTMASEAVDLAGSVSRETAIRGVVLIGAHAVLLLHRTGVVPLPPSTTR